jgi:hypothetical protein
MRRWFEFYSANIQIGQQAVDQLQIDPKFLNAQQAVAQSSELSLDDSLSLRSHPTKKIRVNTY